jgi:endosialidase-like protein
MKANKQMKITTNTICPAFALFTFACFAFLPNVQARQPTPTPTPTASPTPTPTPFAGEDRGNGNSAAEKVGALNPATTGSNNTAHGWFSLFTNTNGNENTADGYQALYQNIDGGANTAVGSGALASSNHGSYNTATGFQAMWYNLSGSENTAAGFKALSTNWYGNDNTAVGANAYYRSRYGSGNTVVGAWALTNGDVPQNVNYNTAVGFQALTGYYVADYNTALGANALYSCAGSNNIGIGSSGGYNLDTGSNNIEIGHSGVSGDNNTIRIGTTGTQSATFIAGISGTPVIGDTVVVDANGQLGTVASAARFKKDVQPMDKNSEAVLALKPVSFHYNNDSKATPQFGLIAEEVAKVSPDLVVHDRNGEIYSVRYEAVNAMLLNEFLKAHRRIEEQNQRIDELTAQLKEQAEEIRKVSDKVEMNRPSPQTVGNDR